MFSLLIFKKKKNYFNITIEIKTETCDDKKKHIIQEEKNIKETVYTFVKGSRKIDAAYDFGKV